MLQRSRLAVQRPFQSVRVDTNNPAIGAKPPLAKLILDNGGHVSDRETLRFAHRTDETLAVPQQTAISSAKPDRPVRRRVDAKDLFNRMSIQILKLQKTVLFETKKPLVICC